MAELRTVPGVELVRTGTWDCSSGPWTCTAGQIAEAVRAGRDQQLTAPVLKLGHTDPRFDGQRAYGQVSNLRATADGQRLVGDLVNVEPWLADLLPSGYPNRSIEGLFDVVSSSGRAYGFALTALALLGDQPAVQGLAPIPIAYDIAAAHGALHGRSLVLTAPLAGTGAAMTGPPYVTPLVRMLAARNGVDLTTITGTGVGGRIRKADVEAAAAAPPGGQRPLAHSGTPAVSLPPVGPRNGAEMAAALGPRPHDYWLPGTVAPPHIAAAQAEWDGKVAAAQTFEEYEATQARGLMHLAGGRTFEQALAHLRSQGDSGPVTR